MNKKTENLVWAVLGILTLVGGLAHLAPSALAGLVNFSLGGITVQLLAGVSGLVVGLLTVINSLGMKIK